MKKHILFGALTLSATLPCFALHDLYGFYVNPSVNYNRFDISGVNISKNTNLTVPSLTKTDSNTYGLGYGIAAGYGLENFPIRFEVEASSQQDAKYNSNPLFGTGDFSLQNFRGTISSSQLMANVIFDFHVNDTVLPYVKVGAGIAHVKASYTDTYPNEVDGNYVNQTGSNTRNNFAWQAAAGSAFKLSNNFYLNGELRYKNLGKAEWNDFYAPDLNGQNQYSLQSKNLNVYQASVGAMWFFGGSRYTAPAGSAA